MLTSKAVEDSNNSAYIIAGVVTAVVGVVVITSLVLLVLRRRKVCFKPKHARFPYCISHSANYSLDHQTSNTSNTNRATDSTGLRRNISRDTADWFVRSFPVDEKLERATVTRQFLTDGQERAVNFNYKLTLYGYDPTHPDRPSKENTSECNNVFMI